MFPMAYTGILSPPAAAQREARRAELVEVRERLWSLSRAFGGGTLTGLHIESAWRAVGWAIDEFEEASA